MTTHQSLCNGYNTAFEVLVPYKITLVQSNKKFRVGWLLVLVPYKITLVQSDELETLFWYSDYMGTKKAK